MILLGAVPALTLVVAPVAASAAAVLARRRDAARRLRATEALADRLRWRLDDEAPSHETLAGYPFGIGNSPRSRRTTEGQHRGRDVVAFDYSHLRTDSLLGRWVPPSRWTVAATSFGTGPDLPRLIVAPQGPAGRLLTRVSALDVDLESEDFNRAFLVSGPDRRFASDLLTPRVMELMLRWPELAWRVVGRRLVALLPTWAGPDERVAMLDLAADIMDVVPEFVVDEKRSEA